MADSRFAVARYLGEGWSVIPIPKGEKGPRVPNWQNTIFDASAFAEDDNIGVRLGEPSGGLTDIDLDSMEAVACAREILLLTQRIHGRPGKPASHYWYVSPGSKSEQFKDTDGSVLVEIRSTGGQTVLPPSTHPSGELLAWEIDKECGRVEPDALRETAALVATASLLAKHWPKGSRHVVARDAAGFLASRDIDPKLIELVIGLAARVAGDSEVADRVRVAADSVRQFKGGGKTTGLPALATALGEEVVKRLRSWFGGANESVVDEMNSRHFVTRIGATSVVGTEEANGAIIFQRPRDAAYLYKGDTVQVGTKGKSQSPTFRTRFEIWEDSNRKRRYREVVFKPHPREADPLDYNLWRGFAVEPKKGDCNSFLEHTRAIICAGNDEYYNFMLDLLALSVQEPGVPSELAVVLRGKQGTGKGVFVRSFGHLFGTHFKQVDKAEHLTGKFNAQLSSKVVIFADEAVWAGDKRDIGPLKRLITEPTLTIERKGIDVISEDNCIHLFMATNERWAAPVGFNERRFFILDVSADHMQDQAYFDPIYEQMKNAGGSALLHFLLERKFNRSALRTAPKTRALLDQQELSLPPEFKWWKGCLYSGSIDESEKWPEWISTEDLYWSFILWCQRSSVTRRCDREELCKTIKSFLPVMGDAKRRWVIGRDEHGKRLDCSRGLTSGNVKVQRQSWQMPSLSVCRASFDKQSGLPTTWPDMDGFELRDPSEPEETL